MDNAITILGARGSVPVSGPAFSRYGGATTCIFVKLAGQLLVLDAGTGIMNLPEEALSVSELPLILTHAHLDHLIGLPMCPYLFRRELHMMVFSQPRAGLTGKEFLDRLLSPPFWPVKLEALPAKVSFHPLLQTFQLGDVLVETISGIHPDGVSLIRLTGGGKRIVLATDCTLTPEQSSSLARFAQDCDLLLCDGQYSQEEWEFRKSFGHSTWIDAAKFGLTCRAKQIRILHHDPSHTDALLDAALPSLLSIHPQCSFAREMEKIVL
ncbi:MAG: MBL fold metallo-hydrolase [Oscillospiraceae bacterium]|nr:MBL fold metallo-hydrolase [Oscillospiraceae bacterium]